MPLILFKLLYFSACSISIFLIITLLSNATCTISSKSSVVSIFFVEFPFIDVLYSNLFFSKTVISTGAGFGFFISLLNMIPLRSFTFILIAFLPSNPSDVFSHVLSNIPLGKLEILSCKLYFTGKVPIGSVFIILLNTYLS